MCVGVVGTVDAQVRIPHARKENNNYKYVYILYTVLLSALEMDINL